MDEAGRGPWAGPVVAAAVILPARPLAVRIDDSKRLTPAQRLRAFHVICARAEFGVGIACAEEVDRRNVLQASLLAMQRAVARLPRSPQLVLVDGPHAPSLSAPAWPLVHGDQLSRAIGAASIVAKVIRDDLMTFYHALLPQYAFDRHKGYGTALHAERLAAHGPSWLHRLSVEPVRAAAEHAAMQGSAGWVTF